MTSGRDELSGLSREKSYPLQADSQMALDTRRGFGEGRREEIDMRSESIIRWLMDPLTNRLVDTANRHHLVRRDPATIPYIDLCWWSASGPVAAQIHECTLDSDGRVLVIGDADENCQNPHQLRNLHEDYEQLSGDHGSNKPWLRATGKTFGHLEPGRLFLVPNRVLSESDNSPVWKAIDDLMIYAADRISSRRRRAILLGRR